MLLEATPGLRHEQRTLEDLMKRYQQADPAAAAELIGQVSPPLLRLFASHSETRDYAEDLLQECWLRIHKSRHTYRPGEPVLPWVFAIARHTRLDGCQKRRRIESHELAVEECEQLAGAAGGAPPGPDVSRLLEELPHSQREVILMLKVSGMTLEEVARATATTVGAVKQKAHRAYKKLHQLLCDSPPAGGLR